MNNEPTDITYHGLEKKSNVSGQIKRLFLPYWPFFIVVLALAIPVAYTYLYYTKEVYQVNSEVLVKLKEDGQVDKLVEVSSGTSEEEKNLGNEIAIFKSSYLMDLVVDKLGLYVTQNRGGPIRDYECYRLDAPLKVTLLDSALVDFSKVLKVSIDFNKKTFSINGINHPLGSTIIIHNKRFLIAANPQFHNIIGVNSIQEITLIFTPSSAVSGSLQNALSVTTQSKESSILLLSINTTVPEKGMDILNAIDDEYNELAIRNKNEGFAKTIKFLDGRLRLLHDDLHQVEVNIQNYKAREDFFDISVQGSAYLAKQNDIDEKIAELNIQLSVLDDIENYIYGKIKINNATLVPSLININDSTLTGLLNSLLQDELLFSKISIVTGQQNDQQDQLRKEIDRLKRSIEENVKNIRSNFLTTKSRLDQESLQNNDLLKDIPKKENGLIEISRERETKNGIYMFLLQKKQETEISAAASVSDSRIINPPSYDPLPVSPKRPIIYFSFCFTALCLLLIIIVIKDRLQQTIMLKEELEDELLCPILAEISELEDKKSQIIIGNGKRSLVAEQFRMLRANLNFLGLSKEKNTILITSSVSGEGKSFIAHNLAAVLSLTDKKVLLIGLDLRKPKIASDLNLKSKLGITDYLIGKATLDEIIQEASLVSVDSLPYLSVICAGTIPPNPTELISTDKFGHLITQLQQMFDYIIIDTPPVGLVSDALILSQFAHVTLYIFRYAVSPKIYLNYINKLIREKKLNNVNVIFNAVKGQSFVSYGYGGYTYGNNQYYK